VKILYLSGAQYGEWSTLIAEGKRAKREMGKGNNNAEFVLFRTCALC
jgi:hypothetical protein